MGRYSTEHEILLLLWSRIENLKKIQNHDSKIVKRISPSCLTSHSRNNKCSHIEKGDWLNI